LDKAREIAEQNHLQAVTQIVVQIGDFSGVQPDSLLFAFDILKSETPASGAQLEIERLPIVLYCGNCGKEYVAVVDDLRCPVCKRGDNEIKQGREMIIKRISGEQNG
jgi:hydrogenase nickel incorporation protein HypA/HybF